MIRDHIGSLEAVYVEFENKNEAIRGISCNFSTLKGYKVSIDLLSKIKSKTVITKEQLDEIKKKQEACPNHKERVDMYVKILEYIRNRTQIKTDKEFFTPTKKDKKKLKINKGPETVQWNMEDLQEHFKAQDEWATMKTSLLSLPSFEEKTPKDVKSEHWKEFEKDKDLDMDKDADFQRFENLLAREAEIDVKEKISFSLSGQRGLLIRSVDYEKLGRIENYKALKELGIDIPLSNCDCEVGPEDEEPQHKKSCYRGETDLMLFYPSDGKLCVRIIEVKRRRSTPWAPNDEPSGSLISKALEQLLKGYKFVLAFLPGRVGNWVIGALN